MIDLENTSINSTLPAAQLFTEDAIKTIVETIKANKGKEVFFLGLLNNEMIVNYVEPLAFGSKNAVPVVSAHARPGDVTIHNHPGGNTEPSDADINIASEFSALNIGSYIIDNDCTTVRVIVKPIREKAVVPVKEEDAASMLKPEGKLASNIENYEYREEQIEMLRSVVNSFNNNLISIIEAGTGIGKSLAYLIPSIFYAVNNKERVIISTNTINLQEQILHKDIPFLQKHLGIKFNSVLIKGRSNYLCLRKLELAKKEHRYAVAEESRLILQTIFEWASKTEEGSKADLQILPPAEVWEIVQAEADTCPRLHCPHFEKCFYYKARRNAAQADIVIANHHLVMADLAIRLETKNFDRAAVLPPSKRIVFDEAHNIEDVGTSYFSSMVSRIVFERLLKRLYAKKGEKIGLLFMLDDIIDKNIEKFNSPQLREIQNTLFIKVINASEEIILRVGSIFSGLLFEYSKDFQTKDSENPMDSIKLRITREIVQTDFWNEKVCENMNKLSGELLKYITEISEILKKLPREPEELSNLFWNIAVEIKGILGKIETGVSKINNFLKDDKSKCRWIEYVSSTRRGAEPYLRFCCGPIYLGESMRKAVFDVNKNIVLTSATLATTHDFSFFKKQIGIDEIKVIKNIDELAQYDPETVKREKLKFITELQLDSPFDYKNNVYLALPYDIPDPGDAAFSGSISDIIYEAIAASGGGALVLFTSYGLMKKVYNQTSEKITSRGIKTMIQGQEHRHTLIKNFRSNISSVLFATSSFWEGIDVKGDSLKLLIITRLPFKVPTEPILISRAEMIKEKGGEPFIEMDLPTAVIKFRQGFGRLIRSKTDRGAVMVLDKRIISKNYGSRFLKALPETDQNIAGIDEILSGLKRFFS